MKLKSIRGVYLVRQMAFSGNGLLSKLAQSAFACFVVFIMLWQMPNAVAETKFDGETSELRKEGIPVLGDPNYKHDSKYLPVYAAMDGSSFALHYCLPGFVPLGLSNCARGRIPGSDPRGVQVVYSYYLRGRDVEQVRMEGNVSYKFPFPVNVDLEGRTPYVAQYKEAFERARLGAPMLVKHRGELQGKYEGLDLYEEPGHHYGSWWAPKDLNKYRTRLGNPPIFACSKNFCFLVLDQGNGWVVTAKFNEAALKDWRAFFVQLNNSISIIMEQ
ncbi:hypothetical protein FBY03_10137 [Pseudomonas sp. SJZ079]|uniref:hypothetical protein n=1 Tax=Pseudomonas sp. SJZ079 TaxID=2572887 RepID=UPI00119BCFFE|nr:hypothetical protein [Pseudomonas sp. SJZ079]TWC42856.1 hypothetical protein FBY03_10137 [Pseudomonas sp. SJZ079]